MKMMESELKLPSTSFGTPLVVSMVLRALAAPPRPLSLIF